MISRLFPVLLVLLLAILPATAADLSGLDWVQRPGAPLPLDAPLVDEHGAATTLRAVAGGLPLILAPGYFRCPTLCGIVRDDLLSALQRSDLRAGRDYALAVVTIDPAETPGDAADAREGGLSRYPGAGAEQGWRYLTGPAASLDAVQQAAGFHARFDPGLRQFLHPAGLLVASPAGLVSGYLMGVGYTPADLDQAVGAARAGVQQAAQVVRMFCFAVDPVTGRVTLLTMRALRLLSVLTALALGGVLAFLHLRRSPA
jgi:protein SCO1/2